ncbi:MAG: tripartite tricarboxylate transporter TctB family protein [Alphaproteobacteria bacterium]|nr:tripartite tricarboxylate transporter TctB family protein [Alphaproteobacteria bacterium]
MRAAEFVMAGALALLSLYLMYESAKLPIGWETDRGPGGGAFPFWLSLGILICSIVIIIRAAKGITPESRSTEPYMDFARIKLFAISAGSITAMAALFHFVGVYVALPLFFIFYVRFVGRHSWRTALALAIAMPIGTFMFFEVGLKILLPKGITEPLFYPLYAFFF